MPRFKRIDTDYLRSRSSSRYASLQRSYNYRRRSRTPPPRPHHQSRSPSPPRSTIRSETPPRPSIGRSYRSRSPTPRPHGEPDIPAYTTSLSEKSGRLIRKYVFRSSVDKDASVVVKPLHESGTLAGVTVNEFWLLFSRYGTIAKIVAIDATEAIVEYTEYSSALEAVHFMNDIPLPNYVIIESHIYKNKASPSRDARDCDVSPPNPPRRGRSHTRDRHYDRVPQPPERQYRLQQDPNSCPSGSSCYAYCHSTPDSQSSALIAAAIGRLAQVQQQQPLSVLASQAQQQYQHLPVPASQAQQQQQNPLSVLASQAQQHPLSVPASQEQQQPPSQSQNDRSDQVLQNVFRLIRELRLPAH